MARGNISLSRREFALVPLGRFHADRMPRAALWLSIALVISTMALIAVAVALWTREDPPSAATQAASTTSPQEWIEAICATGTYQNGRGGNVLTGSTGAATCYTETSQASVFVGTYESQFRFENAAANFSQNGAYAARTDASGQLWVFTHRIAEPTCSSWPGLGSRCAMGEPVAPSSFARSSILRRPI